MSQPPAAARIDRLRRRVTELLRQHWQPNLSSEGRRELTDRMYWTVHAPQERHEGAYFSDHDQFATMAREAEQILGELTHERPGFSLISQEPSIDRTIVACPDGVEVVVDTDQVRRSETDGTTGASTLSCVASAVAEPVDARWLYWSPPGAVEHATARVYVHIPAAQAFEEWCSIVRALEAARLLFGTKIGGSDAMLDRPDGIVVYCTADQLRNVVTQVVRHAGDTNNSVPGFSLPVGPGIGVALAPDEDSSGLMMGSVGHHWSRALVNAWDAQGENGLEDVFGRLSDAWDRVAVLARDSDVAA